MIHRSAVFSGHPVLSLRWCLPVLALLSQAPLGALTISEIMYNPGPGGVEYIEIYNEDAEARDLSHYYFSRGVTYVFTGYETGGSVFIRGKSYMVVSADVDKLLQMYPHLDNSDALFPAVVGPAGDDQSRLAYGVLDNAGETLALVNPGGALECEVEYNNRGGWPAAADGTGHSLVLRDPDLDDPNRNENWAWSPLRGGSPGLANFGETFYEETRLLGPDEAWKLFRGRAEPSDPREAWRFPGFDDAGWEDGRTPMGFTDACYTGTVLSDMQGAYLSVYLRKVFEVPDPTQVDVLVLKVAVDDGFIAYLNGVEVARKNMTGGDAFDARATGNGECNLKADYIVNDVQSRLVQGPNLLCFQVHNQTVTSNDFGIIPEVIAKKGQNIGGAPRVDLDLNEVYWNTPVGESGWIEIYNDHDVNGAEQEVDISGYFLSDDPVNLEKLEFPQGTRIPPGGRLAVDEAQLAASGIQLRQTGGDRTKFLALSRRLPGQPPPTSIQIVDALRVRVSPSPATVGMSDARYPDGDRDFIIARRPTRGEPNRFDVERGVVINELMYHPFYPYDNEHVPGTGGFEKPEDQGEYIELFNRGQQPVNMTGWAFSKGVEFAFPDGTVLNPGSYLVIARDPAYIRQHYGLEAGVLGHWYNERFADDDPGEENPLLGPAVLADGGEKVELVDEIGNPVDGVRYGDNHRWSTWADTRGSSLERIDPNQDGSRPGNWDASDESQKSEWKHYSFRGRYTEGEKELLIMLLTRGIVLVDNLKVTDPANPASPNYITNGDFEAPLTAVWLLDGTHISSGRTTADKKDGQACLKIIATGRGNNRLDRIKVVNPAFPLNRDLLLEFDAKWICGEGTLFFGGTWNTFAHRFFMEVPQKLGTPGKINSVRLRLPQGNQGPLVERVNQDPVLPGGGQEVVVTAEITDSDGVASATLRWSLDSLRAAPTDVPMLDDGQDPDRKAGDGVYSARLPGQAVGKRVVFSILATDTPGNTSRFPYDDRARTHPYLLDPQTQDPAKLRYAVYIHGTMAPLTGGVPEYRILMSNEVNTYLTTRRVMNNDVVDSSFVWNSSRIWYNVGVRYGNSPWTRPGGKSYVVKLPRGDELQGYKKFKLDNRGSEINERVVYHLIRSNNTPGRDPVPYGRSTYARPFVNSAAVGSVFERVEIPGKQFLERWWPNDSEGVLYKLDDKFLVNADGTRRENRDAYVRYPPDGIGNGADDEEYRWYFLHRTREKYDDFSELIDLAKFFTPSSTPATVYDRDLFDRVNVESVIKTLAVEINVDDWDTWGTTRGKNCYLYRPRLDGRWVLIGWDKDLTLGNPGGLPVVPTMFPEVARLLNSPGGKRVYFATMGDMLTRFFEADYLNLFFNQHARDREGRPISGLPASAAGAASFVNTRSATMRQAIPRAVNFELTTGGAEGVVNATQPELVVEGNAPLEVWQIVVRNPDHPAWLDPQEKIRELVLDVNSGSFTWPSPTRWRTAQPIPLAEGINDLEFYAFTVDGIVLESDTLRVLYNLNWDPPQVTSVTPDRGSIAGGTQVQVRGISFHEGPRVFLGTVAAPVKSFDETAGVITVTAPPGTPGPVDVKVQNLDGKSGTLPLGFTYEGARFNRGDVDHDLQVGLNDALTILNYQFFGGPLSCLDAADVDDNGEIIIADPISLLNYLFLGGQRPAAPFDPTGAQAGVDPTPGDPLGCTAGR